MSVLDFPYSDGLIKSSFKVNFVRYLKSKVCFIFIFDLSGKVTINSRYKNEVNGWWQISETFDYIWIAQHADQTSKQMSKAEHQNHVRKDFIFYKRHRISYDKKHQNCQIFLNLLDDFVLLLFWTTPNWVWAGGNIKLFGL